MHLAERIRAVVELDPSRPAIYFRDTSTSWGELADVVAGLDRQLAALGAPDGAAIGLVLRNEPAHLAAAIGLMAGSHCLVTVSPLLGHERLAADIAVLDGCAIVAGSADWDRPRFAEAVAASGAPGFELRHDGELVARRAASSGWTSPTKPGVAIQMLTSGTTGDPKRIDLTYRALEESLAASAHYETAGDDAPRLRDGVRICWAPLVHISGIWGVIKNVVDGRPTALLERFDVDGWVRFVREHRPPVSGLPPTALRMILDAGVPATDLSSLKAIIGGSAPTPPELVDEFLATYGIPVLVVYGATEFAGAVAGWTLPDFQRSWEAKRGSVGRAHPGVDLRVLDPDTGAEVPPAAVGVLEVQSPQTVGAGWVRTNDLARLDADGYLTIVGRADDVIIRGGFKVSPAKVVEVLRLHPGVLDAGVAGVDDVRLGSVPVAAVELRTGDTAPSEAELLAFARERLAAYEVPRTIRVVDALPRTPSLKVSQPALRALLS